MDVGWRKDKFVRLRSWVIMIWRNSIDRVCTRAHKHEVCRAYRPPALTYLFAANDISFFSSALLSFPSLYLRAVREFAFTHVRALVSVTYGCGREVKPIVDSRSSDRSISRLLLPRIGSGSRETLPPHRFRPDDGLRIDYAPRLWMQIEHVYWTDWRSFVSARENRST